MFQLGNISRHIFPGGGIERLPVEYRKKAEAVSTV